MERRRFSTSEGFDAMSLELNAMSLRTNKTRKTEKTDTHNKKRTATVEDMNFWSRIP